MSWNDSIQRKKFKAQQEKQANEYRKLGMTDEQITAMYEFDLAQYRSDRRYHAHTQPFIESCFDDDCNGDEGKSPMLDKFIDKLSVNASDTLEHSRFWWTDEIDNAVIVERIKQMSRNGLELLTLVVFEGYTQHEAASLLGISDRTIRRKICSWKNIFKNLGNDVRFCPFSLPTT